MSPLILYCIVLSILFSRHERSTRGAPNLHRRGHTALCARMANVIGCLDPVITLHVHAPNDQWDRLIVPAGEMDHQLNVQEWQTSKQGEGREYCP